MERNFQERLHDFLVAAREPSNQGGSVTGHDPSLPQTDLDLTHSSHRQDLLYPEFDQSRREDVRNPFPYPSDYNHPVGDQDERMKSYLACYNNDEARRSHQVPGSSTPYYIDYQSDYHRSDTAHTTYTDADLQSYSDIDYRHSTNYGLPLEQEYQTSQTHREDSTRTGGIPSHRGEAIIHDDKVKRDLAEYEELLREQQADRDCRQTNDMDFSYLYEDIDSTARPRKEDDRRVVYDERIKEKYDSELEASRPLFGHEQDSRLSISKTDCDRCEEVPAIISCEQCKDNQGVPAVYCNSCHLLLHRGKLRSHTVTALFTPSAAITVDSNLTQDESFTKYPETDRYDNLFERARSSRSLTYEASEQSSHKREITRSPSLSSSNVSTPQPGSRDIPDHYSYRSRPSRDRHRRREKSPANERSRHLRPRDGHTMGDRISPCQFAQSTPSRHNEERTTSKHSQRRSFSSRYESISPPISRSRRSNERSPNQSRYRDRKSQSPVKEKGLFPVRHRWETSCSSYDGKRQPFIGQERSISPTRHRSRSLSPRRHDTNLIPNRHRSRSLSPRRYDRSLSPNRHRSRSLSPRRHDTSLIPNRHRSRSLSPRRYDRSLSPKRHRSRSRSPRRHDRSLSPIRRRGRSPYSRVRRGRSSSSPERLSRRSQQRDPPYNVLPRDSDMSWDATHRRTPPRRRYRERSPSPRLSQRQDRTSSFRRSSLRESLRDRPLIKTETDRSCENRTETRTDSVDYDQLQTSLSDISDDELIPNLPDYPNEKKSTSSFTGTTESLQQSNVSGNVILNYKHTSNVQRTLEQPALLPQSPVAQKTELSFLERVLQVVKPPECIEDKISKSSNAEQTLSSTKQQGSLSNDSQTPYHPFCPLCSEQLGCVQRLPHANMITLREHALTVHMPWYVAIKQYKVDGSDERRTRLADQLFPVINHSVVNLKMMADFFTRLWGKLLHGIVFHLCAKLKLQDPENLYRYVIENRLYPDSNIVSDTILVLQDEEKILMNCHQAFVHDGLRLLEISPPNCVSAILHWITLVNILCLLPREDQMAFSKFEMYSYQTICVLPPETKSVSCHLGKLNKYWTSIKRGHLSELCEMITFWRNLLTAKTTDEDGTGAVQYALSFGNYTVARALLFFGANVDMKDNKGWTPLCRAAYKGDLLAVEVLLAWNASEQLLKAMHIAKCEGHAAVFNALREVASKVKKETGLPSQPKCTLASKSSLQEQHVDIFAKDETTPAGESAVRCKLCSRLYSGEDDLKSHVMSKHLPWYIGMTYQKSDTSYNFLVSILKPALLPHIRRNQRPFEYFSKLWGKLAHSFLTYLSEQLKLTSAKDLLWHVTQNRLTPDRNTRGTDEERLLMEAHCIYLQEEKKKIELSPPNCLSAVLNYTCIVNILCTLSSKCIEEIPTYQKYKDLESLQEDIFPSQFEPNKGSASRSEFVSQQKFWRSIKDGNLRQLWTILLEHSEYKYLYGSKDIDTSPVQFAISSGQLEVARFLLFYGSPTDRKDIEGFNPLWRAAFKGQVKTVDLLLPWETPENKSGALNMAEIEGHSKVVRLIKHSLRKGEDSKEGQPSDRVSKAQKGVKTQPTQLPKQVKLGSGKKKSTVVKSTVSSPQGRMLIASYSQASISTYSMRPGFPPYCPFPPYHAPPPCHPGMLRPPPFGLSQAMSPRPEPGPFWGVPPSMSPLHILPPMYYPPTVEPNPQIVTQVETNAVDVSPVTVFPKKARAATNLLSLTGYGVVSSKELDASSVSSAGVPAIASSISQGRPINCCSLCKNQTFSDMIIMKEHVLTEHFPWYIGIEYHKNEMKRSKLAEQILPLILIGYKEQKSIDLPATLSRHLLGKLCHGFLEYLAQKFSLSKPVDLFEYIKRNGLFSHSDDLLTPGDEILIACHQEFVGNVTSPISISPPNCLSACLHWNILVRIVSVVGIFPKYALITVRAYEKYSSANIIEKKGEEKPKGSISVIADTLIDFIKEDNLSGLCQSFSDNPGIANAIQHDLHGSNLIHYAMSLNKFPAACIMLLYGIPVDHKNNDGQTPLHSSAINGSLEQVKYLLAWGALDQITKALETTKLKGPAALYKYLENVCTSMGIRKDISKSAQAEVSLKRPAQTLIDSESTASSKRVKLDSVSATCLICHEQPKCLKVHIYTQHLPWYIGIFWRVYPNENDIRETKLCNQVSPILCKAIRNKALPPPCIQTLWGNLLAGFINFLTMLLGLSSNDQLFSYVCQNKLWPEGNSQLASVEYHDKLVMTVYQNTLGEGEKDIQVSPPNQTSALLHWGVLTKILTQIHLSTHSAIMKYETYTWDKTKTILPSGPQKLPKVWAADDFLNVKNEIIKAIAHSDLHKLCELLEANLHILQSQSGGDEVLADCLTYSLKNAATYNPARVLLLCGLPVDIEDCNQWTRLHHAIKDKHAKCVELLLEWDASIDIKNNQGQTPYDLSNEVGCSHEIVLLLEEAKKKSIEKLAENHEILKEEDLQKASNFEKSKEVKRLQRTTEHFEDVCDRPDPSGPTERRQTIKKTEVQTEKSTENGRQQKSVETTWICPICKERTTEARLHALLSHLPWYVCISVIKDGPISLPRKTPLATKFADAMAVAITNKFFCDRPGLNGDGCMPVTGIPVSCFLQLQGHLLDQLLHFVCEQLSISQTKELLRYVIENRLWPGSQAELLESDKQSMYAYQTFIGDEKKELTIGPPNHVSALLHWNCLVNIIAKLPEMVQLSIVSFEKYQMKETECIIKTVSSAKGSELTMSVPSVTGVPDEAKADFCLAIDEGNFGWLSSVLDEWPVLAYYPIPESGMAGPIGYALSKGQYLIPALLVLYGASPDQMDGRGWSPLHSAVECNDLEAVQILLDLGTNTSLKNPQGMTALEISIERKSDAISRILQDAETNGKKPAICALKTTQMSCSKKKTDDSGLDLSLTENTDYSSLETTMSSALVASFEKNARSSPRGNLVNIKFEKSSSKTDPILTEKQDGSCPGTPSTSSSVVCLEKNLQQKSPRSNLVVIKFDKSQSKSGRISHPVPESSEYISQPVFVTSEPNSQPALASSELSSQPALVSSETSSQPALASSGLASSGPSSQPALASSRPCSQPALASSRPSSQPALASSRPSSQPALASSRPSSQPALASSKPSSQPALASSRPCSQPAHASSEARSQSGYVKLTVSNTKDMSESTLSAPVSWNCPVCHLQCRDTGSFKKHASHHLPWYVCMDNLQCDLSSSRLARLVKPFIQSALAENKLPASIFTKTWGEMLHKFLMLLCNHLKLSGIAMLWDYVIKNRLWTNELQLITSTERFTMYAYQTYRSMSKKSLSISPPNHESTILHWTCVLNILAKLPAGMSETCISFEQLDLVLKRTECKFVKTSGGENKEDIFKMTVPVMTPELRAKGKDLKEAIINGNLEKMCQMLDTSPLLVYSSIPGMNHCGIICLALCVGNTELAVAAYLYGACVDHLDRTGRTPLLTLISSKKNYKTGIKMLVWMGASLQAKWRGKTPYQLAKEKGILHLLPILSAGANK